MIRRNPDILALALLMALFGVVSVGRRVIEAAAMTAPALHRIGVLSKHLEAETDDLAERLERRVSRQVEQIDRRVNEQAERLQKKLNERIAEKIERIDRLAQ